MRPVYAVTVDGVSVPLHDRLVSLSVRRERGFEADSLEMVIDDTDGRVEIPPEDARVRVQIGWAPQGLGAADMTDLGEYVIDDTEHNGPPDQITIRGSSADFRAGLKEKRTESYDQTTLGGIIDEMAARHGLTAAVAPGLAAEFIEHIDQTDESDAHLLTRLGEQYDAVATIKEGRLLFTPSGQGRSASGLPLLPAVIQRSDGDAHTWSRPAREQGYTGVAVTWMDRSAFQAQELIVGDEGNLHRMRRTFPSEEEARSAAEAEWKRLQRADRTLRLTLPGRGDLPPETPAVVHGFKADIDGSGWIVASDDHALDDNGWTVDVELERGRS